MKGDRVLRYYHVLRMGSVTNNSTRVRIGYRIYSLWRLQLQAAATQVTITMITIALVASRIPLTELHLADVSLRGLTDEDWLRRPTDSLWFLRLTDEDWLTHSEADRRRQIPKADGRGMTISVYCLPFFNAASNNGNTGPPTVGYHVTQQ
jgi:hypothetical protein